MLQLVILRIPGEFSPKALHYLGYKMPPHSVVCEHACRHGPDHPTHIAKTLVSCAVGVDSECRGVPEITVVLKNDANVSPTEIYDNVRLAQGMLKIGRYLDSHVDLGCRKAATSHLDGQGEEQDDDRLHGGARSLNRVVQRNSCLFGSVAVVVVEMLAKIRKLCQRGAA